MKRNAMTVCFSGYRMMFVIFLRGDDGCVCVGGRGRGVCVCVCVCGSAHACVWW